MTIRPPFVIRHVDHVSLRVRDLSPMQASCCDVLDGSIHRRQDAIGLLQLRAGASPIDLADAASMAAH